MIRTAFAGALLCLISACSMTPALAASSLHPRCNIDWPCEVSVVRNFRTTPHAKTHTSAQREYPFRRGINNLGPQSGNDARASRYARAEFGSPVVAPETASSYINGVVPVLAAKASEIVAACGARLGNNARHSTYVRGTRRVSLHKSGKAIDIFGNSACIYSHLQGWPGGYSIDSHIGHIHVSYDAEGGREMGLRFVHGGHRKHRRRIASR